MKTVWISAAITVILAEVFAAAWGSEQGHERGTFGLINLLLGVAALLLGVVLCIPNQTRNSGKGILLGSGVLLLIGLAVCSTTSNGFG